jgi:hypothetical protein
MEVMEAMEAMEVMEAMEAMEVMEAMEAMEVMEAMEATEAMVTIVLAYIAPRAVGIGGQHIGIMFVKDLKTIIMEIVYISRDCNDFKK